MHAWRLLLRMCTILNFIVQFDAPVVAAWYLLHDQMYPIDLFTGAQWTPTYNDHMGPLTPSLYIGMHNRQVSLSACMYMTSICLHWQCAFCSEYCNGNYVNVSNSVYQFMDFDVLHSCITQNLCLWPIPYIGPSCVRKSWLLCWLKNFSFVSSCLSSAYKCCNVLHIPFGSNT